MTPKFIQLPEKKVVGLGTKFISIRSPDKNNMKTIPGLWDRFMGQMGQIKNRIGHASLGLVEDIPKGEPKSHKDELFYIACVEVADLASVPPGMIHRTVPAGQHAIFTHTGPLTGLETTMNFIYGDWIKNSGVKLRNAPHIEIYDQRFKLNAPESEFDLLLPVQ